MFVRSNGKKKLLILCLCLFVDYRKKKYKELELTKLEFHITRNSSFGSSSTIEEKKKKSNTLKFCIYKELEHCVAWNSSLPSSSIVLNGTRVYQARVPCGITSFFMKLECLKLNLQCKLEFQKSGILLLILQTVVCC